MSFSAEFDAIQEARRSDDPSLEQGEWVTSIKEADWKLAAETCAALLSERTKDLRLVSWLTEALAKLHGAGGLNAGLRVMHALTESLWDQLHPQAEGGDQEERIGNISWLVSRCSPLVSEFPILKHKSGAYSLQDLETARSLQGLLERNPDAASEHAHKTSMQQIREAQRSTPSSFFIQTQEDCQQCLDGVRQLSQAIDVHLGMDGPSFSPLLNALEGYLAEIRRLGAEGGVGLNDGATAARSSDTDSALPALTSHSSSHQQEQLASRTQALRQLREVAEYFRRTEPHSPVAYLAEKAARWGEMPLHLWLKAVLKEDGALARFEDLLDFDAGSPE